MKTVFLCGGIGKRMHPIAEEKFLLKFAGKTLLERHIDAARSAGLKDFVIIGNPHNIEKIKDLCSRQNGANFEFAVQKEPKGMADAMLSASHIFDGEDFIVVNTNDIFEPSAYKNILDAAKNSEHDSLLTGYEVQKYFPGGYFRTNENGEMIELVEKPGAENMPSNLLNIVLHLHRNTKKHFKHWAETKSEKDDIYERALTEMVKSGGKIKVVPYSGFWTAIKYPWHIHDAAEFFMKNQERKISPNAKISERAVVDGNVVIEDGVRIFENAVVRGPAYIGKNTIIGNNALVWSGSHIGDNSVVGFSTEIKHSYIGDNCWFHSNYVGDSIILDNTTFGAGTITANLRFDNGNVKVNVRGERVDTGTEKFGAIFGENCKTGINCVILPGIKIGPNSFVGPHVHLDEDLEPDKMIFLKQSHVVKENTIKPGKSYEEFRKKLPDVGK
ncbi:MAG TPA: sugar phosphate nucleotidyltransferase [archaeon]|nr:sugar phosphate nucleotidyltransferase [archaeon]